MIKNGKKPCERIIYTRRPWPK